MIDFYSHKLGRLVTRDEASLAHLAMEQIRLKIESNPDWLVSVNQFGPNTEDQEAVDTLIDLYGEDVFKRLAGTFTILYTVAQ